MTERQKEMMLTAIGWYVKSLYKDVEDYRRHNDPEMEFGLLSVIRDYEDLKQQLETTYNYE